MQKGFFMRALAFRCALACLLLSASAPAALAGKHAAQPPAQTGESDAGKNKITLNIDPALRRQEAAYQDAVKTLSPQQQAVLRALERVYMKTTGAAIDMMALSAQVDFCNGSAGSAIAKNSSRYVSELGVLRDHQQAAQAADRARLYEAEASKVDFVDKKLLDSHLAFVGQLTEGIGKGVVADARSSGGFGKTDCKRTAAKLDGGFVRASADDVTAEMSDPGRVAEIRKAADAGNLDAMASMAMMEITGRGFPKDFEKGRALLTAVAEKGDGRAQYMLGLVLASDVFGGTVDKEKARYWLQKAADQGNRKAAAMLSQVDAARPQESPGPRGRDDGGGVRRQ